MARPWDRTPPRDYLRLQEALLHEQVARYLYPFSPFYRKLFDDHDIKPQRIRRLRDLDQVPLSSAEDFAAVPEDSSRPFRALLRPDERGLKRWAHRDVLRRVAREKLVRGDESAERLLAEEFKPVHLHLPAGPGPLAGYTMRDLSALSQAGARSLAVMGVTRQDVLVSTLPFGPHLPFWHVHYGAQGAGLGAVHLGAGEAVRPHEAAVWMARLGATVLASQAAYADGFLRGAPPAAFARLRVLVLWAIGGMRGARERFTARLRAAGAPDAGVATLLGIPEARVAWADCPAPPGQAEAAHGYHTYPDLELLEVVDGEGRGVGEGEAGELVYTSLDWRGSALLRYRTGVVARRGITTEACPGCGRTVPRVLPDLSRVDWRAMVSGPRGPLEVDLADILPELWGARGVALWQVEVTRGGGLAGADAIVARLGGASPGDVAQVQARLAPYGVRCRAVPVRELGQRMGVGTERPERRVVVRAAR
ncbi:MAG TPA: hypothetical protein VGB51_05100 [Actinomycetota bacterium]